MSGTYGAIHYQAKTEPIQPVAAPDVTTFIPSSLARPRVITKIRRPSGAAMVFPHVPIVQIFEQAQEPKVAPYPFRQEQPHFNIFPETPKLSWLQQAQKAIVAAHPNHVLAGISFDIAAVAPAVVQLAWLHDFARILEEQRRDPNSVSGRAAPVWTEDDDVRYRHLIKYIQ